MEELNRPQREHYIDWLRTIGILLLFPFHTARVFDIWEPFYVKSAQQSGALSFMIVLLAFWFMPLLFMLSGASAQLALKKRTPAQFIAERVKRLLIPFIFGVLVIIPPQGYLSLLAAGKSTGYLEFLKGYFVDWSDLSGYFGSFTPAHLWFILFLFIISLIGLLIIKLLRKPVVSFFSRPWAALLLFIPMTLAEALPDIGGKNIIFYLVIFICGYILFADEKTLPAISAWLRFIAPLAAVTSALYLIGRYTLKEAADFSAVSIAMAFLRNIAMWSLLLTLLSLGRRYLNKPSALLSYASKAAFPVYILHQTVLVAVAYFIEPLHASVAVRFGLIMVISLIVSVGLYDVLRRVPIIRGLIGIKAK